MDESSQFFMQNYEIERGKNKQANGFQGQNKDNTKNTI